MSKVLLFDFDGTIADSFDSFLAIIPRLADKHNFRNPPREELEKLRSEDAKSLIKYLKIPLYKIPFLALDMKRMQHEQIADIEPFTGLPEVLHELTMKGYVLGILTSNGEENVKLFIKKNKIDIFSYIYSDSSIFGKHKVIRKFLKQHKLAKDDVTYIGDEIRDIQACQNVGMKIIAVTWGFNVKKGLTKYHPDFIINKPHELLDVLAT